MTRRPIYPVGAHGSTIVDGRGQVVAIVADGMFEMVNDPTIFAHPTCCDNHHRSFAAIQCHAFILRLHVRKSFEIEHIIIVFECFLNITVHIASVFTMNVSQSNCKRAVDEHWDSAHRIFISKFIQQIDQHLRSAETERRNNDSTTPLCGFADDTLQFGLHIRCVGVDSIAVG